MDRERQSCRLSRGRPGRHCSDPLATLHSDTGTAVWFRTTQEEQAMATSPATRALTDADHPAIAELAAAAFPATQSRFVRPGPDGGLVMTIDG